MALAASKPQKPSGVPEGLTGFVSNVVTDVSVYLNWDEAARARTYNIKRSTDSGGPYTYIIYGCPTNSYSDIIIFTGLTYYYVVSSANRDELESPDSEEIAIHVRTPTWKIPARSPPTLDNPLQPAAWITYLGFIDESWGGGVETVFHETWQTTNCVGLTMKYQTSTNLFQWYDATPPFVKSTNTDYMFSEMPDSPMMFDRLVIFVP
jgi:hypothetical protein